MPSVVEKEQRDLVHKWKQELLERLPEVINRPYRSIPNSSTSNTSTDPPGINGGLPRSP